VGVVFVLVAVLVIFNDRAKPILMSLMVLGLSLSLCARGGFLDYSVTEMGFVVGFYAVAFLV
jgi:hypothetical protein